MSLVLLGERGRKSGAGAVKEWVKAPIVVVVLPPADLFYHCLFLRYDHLKMPTWSNKISKSNILHLLTWSAFRGLIATVYWTFAHN